MRSPPETWLIPIAAAVRRLALAAMMVSGSMASGASAQTAELDDPPGRVGRLSHLEGTVSFRDADEEQWVPATLNFPVTSGASFWTEPNARAEIQIGSADLRLDQITAIQLVQLDDSATQIAVDQGAINVRLRDMPPGGVRIITPRASVALIQPGRYHIDVAPPQDDTPSDHVRVAVLEGAARIDGLAAPLTVTTGHSATLAEGEAHPLLAQAITLPVDTWALERERALNPQETVRYVSPEMTGYQDLERHGQWSTDPNYGAIWYPRTTVVDWAPYRYGHWAYVRPWGWTWIDHEPWGFAPFHYGRWVRVHDRWGWCPGRRVVRPIYAPALVAFVGGSNFSVAVISGRRAPAVGWIPLGPREVYRPHHHHSTTYVRNVNITHVNVTNVTTPVIHRDRDHDRDGRDKNRDSIRSLRNRDGLTVVSSSAFTGAAPVDKARVRLRADDIGDAKTTGSLDHLKPSRSAKAGLVAPAAATSGGSATAPGEERRRSRRNDRDDDRLAPPTSARTTTALTEPSRNPEVLPRAPGPTRERRASVNADDERTKGRQADNVSPSDRRNREPVGSPLDRPNQAAPALRTPNSATAAPSAARSPDDGRNRRIVPPGRAPDSQGARPSAPPGRQPNPAANTRRDSDGRDGDRDVRNDGDRRESDRARVEKPSMAPRPLTPAQTPGRAPNTAAPARPAPIAPSPANQQNPDRTRPAAAPPTRASEPPRDAQRGNPSNRRPDGLDRRRDEPRPGTPGGGAEAKPPGQGSSAARTPSSAPRSAPSRPSPQREAVERRPQQPNVQRMETQRGMRQEPRREARPQAEPRREARPQAQPAAPRDMTPRRAERPARAQPQEAQRSRDGHGRSDDSRRNGG